MVDPFPNHRDCAECPWREHLEAQPSPSVSQAADELVALINSRVTSPTKSEIESIIAKVGTRPDALANWDRLMAKWQHETLGADDDQGKAADDRVFAVCMEHWTRPARDWNDVAVLAAMAKFWNWPSYDEYDVEQLNYEAVLARKCSQHLDEKSFAHLLQGIAEVLERPLDRRFE